MLILRERGNILENKIDRIVQQTVRISEVDCNKDKNISFIIMILLCCYFLYDKLCKCASFLISSDDGIIYEKKIVF